MNFISTFTHRNDIYSIMIEWNEAQLSEGLIDLKTVVTRRNVESEANEIVIESRAIVEIDEERGPLLKIEVQGHEVFSERLAEIFGEESTIGQIMESIPAYFYGGDAILGCLVRSGCSATVGQIIICKDETISIQWSIERLRAIGSCLRRNIPDILLKTVSRAIRCMVRAGF